MNRLRTRLAFSGTSRGLRHEHAPAAGRAGGPRRQPPVDALEVKPMVAARKDPYVLTWYELREADGALGDCTGEPHTGGVDQPRQPLQGLPSESGLCRPVRPPERAAEDGLEAQRTYQGAQ